MIASSSRLKTQSIPVETRLLQPKLTSEYSVASSQSQSTRSMMDRVAAHLSASPGRSCRGPSATTRSFGGRAFAMAAKTRSATSARLKIMNATGLFTCQSVTSLWGFGSGSASTVAHLGVSRESGLGNTLDQPRIPSQVRARCCAQVHHPRPCLRILIEVLGARVTAQDLSPGPTMHDAFGPAGQPLPQQSPGYRAVQHSLSQSGWTAQIFLKDIVGAGEVERWTRRPPHDMREDPCSIFSERLTRHG